MKELNINKAIINTTSKTKTLLKTGKLLNINYIAVSKRNIKITYFVGLCLYINRKKKSLMLRNKIKKEEVKIVIFYDSPLVLNIQIINKYKKKFRLKKLNLLYKKK